MRGNRKGPPPPPKFTSWFIDSFQSCQSSTWLNGKKLIVVYFISSPQIFLSMRSLLLLDSNFYLLPNPFQHNGLVFNNFHFHFMFHIVHYYWNVFDIVLARIMFQSNISIYFSLVDRTFVSNAHFNVMIYILSNRSLNLLSSRRGLIALYILPVSIMKTWC